MIKTSKLLRDAAFTRQPRDMLCWLKKSDFFSGNLAILTVPVLEKVLFLLVPAASHVGARPDRLQHGVSSANLCKFG